MASRLRKGDKVIVISGGSKGQSGVISSVAPKSGKVTVEDVNLSVRHTKKSASSEGGKVKKALPLDACKLALIDPKTGSKTKVGFRFENGKKVRFSKVSGVNIDE